LSTLWFCVPVHGRFDMTRVCLRQLRRTCDSLTDHGVEASAVIVGYDENLDTARELDFGIVERNNRALSRKYNDGIQLACDPAYNRRPANYVVPCGSDDWVDYRLFLDLPARDTLVGFKRLMFVRPDGREIMETQVDYPAGCGIRIYPRWLMKLCGYRPGEEDRNKACDTSILMNLQRIRPNLIIEERNSDARQIVDWKSDDEEQVTTFGAIVLRHRPKRAGDPFQVLRDIYPDEALEEMRALYSTREPVAA
jgi:hypothetical protein